MSTTLINILLAITGLLGSLAAFGGETWNEGKTALVKRITKRGYLSLFCLLAAFAIGIYKEISNNTVIDKKDDKIALLQSELSKVQVQLSSYKNILTTIKDESHRQEQVVMAQFVMVHGQWGAPNLLYPGSVLKFYQTSPGGSLVIRYGNLTAGYREDRLNIRASEGGLPYEIPIVGNSGQPFEWSLIGNWEGKVFVYSSPRQREPNWSWQEESSAHRRKEYPGSCSSK